MKVNFSRFFAIVLVMTIVALGSCKKDVAPIGYFSKTRSIKKQTINLKILSDAEESGWVYSVDWGDETDSTVLVSAHTRTISHSYFLLPCPSCIYYDNNKTFTITLRVKNKDGKQAVYRDTVHIVAPDYFSPTYTYMSYQISGNTYTTNPSISINSNGTDLVFNINGTNYQGGNIYSLNLSNFPTKIGTYSNHSSSGPFIGIYDNTGNNYSYSTSGSTGRFGTINVNYLSSDSLAGTFNGRIGNYAGYWDVSNGQFFAKF